MSTNTKYIKVSDLKENKLIFPSFLNPVQEKEIERLSFEDDRIEKIITWCKSFDNRPGYTRSYIEAIDDCLNYIQYLNEETNKNKKQ